MIQTVSPTRILPPLSRNKGAAAAYRHKGYIQRLTNLDQKKFNSSLSKSVGLKDYQEILATNKTMYIVNRDLQLEIIEEKQKNEKLTEDLEGYHEMKADYESLLETMVDWRSDMGQKSTKEDVVAEMKENREILGL